MQTNIQTFSLNLIHWSVNGKCGYVWEEEAAFIQFLIGLASLSRMTWKLMN